MLMVVTLIYYESDAKMSRFVGCHVDFEALQAYVAAPWRAGGVSSSDQGRIGAPKWSQS